MTAARRSLQAVVAELAELRDLYGRGLVVELLWANFDTAALSASLSAAGLRDVDIVPVDEQPDTLLRLRALNRARDVVLPAGRSVVFVAKDGASTRVVRRECPDLTSVFDLTSEIGTTTMLTFDALATGVRAAQARRYERIDLTGLVPHTAELVGIRLADVFERSAALPPLKGGVRKKPWLVVGPPGAGKSTALRFIAWADAQEAATGLDLEGRLPIVAPMAVWAAWSRDREISLEAFLDRFVGGLLGLDEVSLREHLPRLVLLLDGLDEVSAASARRVLLAAAAGLFEAGAAVVFTAREHTVDELDAPTARVWGVQRWASVPGAASRRFVVRLMRARGTGDDAQIEARADGIVRHPDFVTFAHNPLLLTFLVVLAEVQGDMPTQRVELYRDLVEMMISSWRRLRDPARGRAVRRADVMRVVGPLGWQLVRQGVGGLTEPELEAVLVGQERDRDNATAAAQERLALLREDTALLRCSDGLWRFNHPTIAEYLAACAVLQDDRKLDVLCADPFDPAMTQVLAFTLALVTDVEPRDAVAERILEALRSKSKRPGVYDAKIPRTLALCLTEARDLPARVQDELAERAFCVAFERKLTPLRRSEAVSAVRTLFSSSAPPIRAVVERWLVPPSERIDWGSYAEGMFRGGNMDELPGWLRDADYDPGPMLGAWLRHSAPEVRLLAIGTWAEENEDRWQALSERDQNVVQVANDKIALWHSDYPSLDRSPWLEARYPGILAEVERTRSAD